MTVRRKQDDISVLDLMDYPVWEFALDEEGRDGQDENTLRPYPFQPPLKIEDVFLIVRARFVLSNGTALTGFVKPQPLGESKMMKTLIPYDLNPVILTEQGPVYFCFGFERPDDATISEYYKRIGFEAENVFPIHFSSDIVISDGISQGILEGFLYFEGDSLSAFSLKDSDVKVLK